jgi:hypothetical protein
MTSEVLQFPNPWQPITDPTDIKCLGKLLEEVNELGAALSRCIIQGVDEAEPVTGKINREWLEDELADVKVNVNLVIKRFGLQIDQSRVDRKTAFLEHWHNNTKSGG